MRQEGFLWRWYEASESATVRDPIGWEAANPSSWIRREDLAREAERLPESVFRRLHLNQWTETEDAWIKSYVWDLCKGEPIFDPAQPSYIGVDVGIRRDSAAIVWGQWHEDRLHIGAIIMTPEDMGEGFGVADVRAALATESLRHQALREADYDPWSFRESAELLAEQGLPMVEFPQTAGRMAPASENLFELCTEGRLVHNGNYTLRKHVLAAVSAPTARGGWRISKRKSLERIDACIALAVMADRAVALRHAKPPRRGAAFL